MLLYINIHTQMYTVQKTIPSDVCNDSGSLCIYFTVCMYALYRTRTMSS